jgi:hypothetical protein
MSTAVANRRGLRLAPASWQHCGPNSACSVRRKRRRWCCRSANTGPVSMELIDIFYATTAEKEIADRETIKLANHIRQLSPGFEVDISVFSGSGERKSDRYKGSCVFGVYNPPRRNGACSITITADEEWTNQGLPCFGFYRGQRESHLRAEVLLRQGDRSVETSVHEWLHYFASKRWNIDPHDQPDYSYPGKEYDCEQNGWRYWYTALLGTERPRKIDE